MPHTFAVPSELPVTRREEFGLQATLRKSVSPGSVWRSFPVSAAHTRVASSLAAATYRPSGLQDTPRVQQLAPLSVNAFSPVSTSNTAVPCSNDATARRLPSGLRAVSNAASTLKR